MGIEQKTFPTETWMERELAGCKFRDVRLEKRFRKLFEQLSGAPGESIPMVCQDWANTKAAYRFFSNERVSEEEILAGHFGSTRERVLAESEPILVLHDTTEFTFKREDIDAIGRLNKGAAGKNHLGQTNYYTSCGILMHSSLAVTTDGLPLGMAAIKFWTRQKFKGTNALKKRINPTRVPIEQKESIRWLENLRQSTALLDCPQRCIHVGDRESDIYELFCAAKQVETHFVVRTCVDRLAGKGDHTIADEMKDVGVKGLYRIEVRNNKGQFDQAILEIKYHRLRVLPPIGKQRQYPELTLTVIHAQETTMPKDREKIDWKLMTDLPVNSRTEAIQKIQWYALRWKIELFHKILKSGCRAEQSKLRTAERLVNLISVFSVLSWRIFWLTMINRTAPEAPPELALTKIEIGLLDELLKDSSPSSPPKNNLSTYLTKIARLGGYLGRANDSPPGNTVMWRGMARLTDIALGFAIAAKLCG
jgi:hypothetical protein